MADYAAWGDDRDDLPQGRAVKTARAVVSSKPTPATKFLDAKRLTQARELAHLYEKEEGRTGTAMMILVLVDEIETLREAFKGATVIVNQAASTATLAQLKASVLLGALEQCREYLDRRSDVIDGCNGCPRPNAAMSLLNEIDAALAVAGAAR